MVESRATLDITQWLQSGRRGDVADPAAYEQVVTALYGELHQMAVSYMRRENSGRTIQATALVHEAYERLVGIEIDWQDRAHFLSLMGQIMRRLLVDHARARHRQKRGHGAANLNLDDVVAVAAPDNSDIVELHEALCQLGDRDPRKERALELFYFSGLKHEEIAEVLDVSLATVDRDLRMGRAWIRKTMFG